jgi:hypothetical protein
MHRDKKKNRQNQSFTIEEGQSGRGISPWERLAGVKKRSETVQSLLISKGKTLIYIEGNTQHLTPFPNLLEVSYTPIQRIPNLYPYD